MYKRQGTTSDGQAIIRLTLFRATGNTFPIHNDLLISFGEETSQCIGPQVFEYALYFHAGEEVEVQRECRLYQTGPLAAQVGAGGGGHFPDCCSLFGLRNPRVGLSAVKLAEDGEGTILRLYNPGGRLEEEWLELPKSIASVQLTDLNEQPLENLSVQDNRVRLTLPPYHIVTVLLRE